MLAALLANPDSLKRLLVKLFGLALVFLAPMLMSKFGVTITDAQVESAAGIVALYIVQSGLNSAAKAKAEGVAAVPDREAALKSLAEAAGVEVKP